MFTGLVETIGEIAAVEGDDRRGVRFLVATPLAAELADGDSIAVNGVCLTAREVEGDRFAADVMAETLRRSSLGPLGEGDRVNLELPLRPDGRLGGHVVHRDRREPAPGELPVGDREDLRLALGAGHARASGSRGGHRHDKLPE